MTSLIWRKRAYKLKGFLIYVCSLVLFRYSRLNVLRLRAFFRSHPVDRLHVGCGLALLNGWCNVLFERHQEYGKLKKVNGLDWLNYDLLKPWPWPENSISFIAGAHFIEHLDLNQCILFCKEAFKVLKSGGTIRLSCPDLEVYARNYLEENRIFFEH